MQTFKLVLGSTAFFLCLWLTAGLVGNSLLDPLGGDCGAASPPRQTSGSIRAEDILRTLCLVHGEGPDGLGQIKDVTGQEAPLPYSGKDSPTLHAG